MRARCFDNIFNERLRRLLKYEEAHFEVLKRIDGNTNCLARNFKFYNGESLELFT